MDRRSFLHATGMAVAGLCLPGSMHSSAAIEARPRWRTFEVTTDIEVLHPAGTTRMWLPVPLVDSSPFQRTLGNRLVCEGASTSFRGPSVDAPGMYCAEFPPGERPRLTLSSTVATRDWRVDLSAPERRTRDRSGAQLFLQPTAAIPTDGIVRETSLRITRGITDDLAKARAIYEWVVENSYRKPAVRGCGIGNIKGMLETGDLGGKCADISALYTGLARAAGLPARDVYGIRVAPSDMGYRCLGVSSDDITRAQHCRAEVHLSEYGWVPVDPADVRKVMLEDVPGGLDLQSERVQSAQARLFGSWEMNWIAYNFAQDVSLPGSSEGPLPFFMYPQAETAHGRLDSLAPDEFRYRITTRELTHAAA